MKFVLLDTLTPSSLIFTFEAKRQFLAAQDRLRNPTLLSKDLSKIQFFQRVVFNSL